MFTVAKFDSRDSFAVVSQNGFNNAVDAMKEMRQFCEHERGKVYGVLLNNAPTSLMMVTKKGRGVTGTPDRFWEDVSSIA